MSSKFDQLECLFQGKIDILVLPESKLSSFFPAIKFLRLLRFRRVHRLSKVIIGPLDLKKTETEVVFFYLSGIKH